MFNSKLRIVVLGTRGFPWIMGGVEAHCANLYPRLVKMGCEVTVFTRKPYIDARRKIASSAGSKIEPPLNDEMTIDWEWKGVKFIILNCPKNKFLEAMVHTWRGLWAARKLKPDILHIHAIGPAMMVPLAKMMGMKVVLTHHGPDYERKKWKGLAKYFLKWCERSGVTNADKIICIAESIMANLRGKYRCALGDTDRLVFIPNGVIIPRCAPTFDTLKKSGLEKGKYLLAVGRFVPEKGFHDLIRAYIDASLGEWKLVIAGDTDHPDAYSRSLKRAAQESQNIVLTGFATGQPLQELYSHAGLFVLPSYYEGLPIVLLEAMSFGLSCLVSDIPANREFHLPQERYFKPGDAPALSGKIAQFISRPLTEEEKSAQIEYIRTTYDWDLIAQRTLQVYKEII